MTNWQRFWFLYFAAAIAGASFFAGVALARSSSGCLHSLRLKPSLYEECKKEVCFLFLNEVPVRLPRRFQNSKQFQLKRGKLHTVATEMD